MARASKMRRERTTAPRLVVLLMLAGAGCTVSTPYDRDYVSLEIGDRTTHKLGETVEAGTWHLPAEVSIDDGLSLDEAVAIALWNNAQFQADLVDLGFARADLAQASFLKNPVFSLLFPVGPKTLEAAITLPVDALWQRPHRVAAARLDAERVAENLVQNGLGLIRDVEATYVELLCGQRRSALAEEIGATASEIARITWARMKAGDISELESSQAIVDSLAARDAAARASRDAALLSHRLDSLLGRDTETAPFELDPQSSPRVLELPVEELIETAFAARPELRAAELAIEAAGERLGWERSKIFNFIGIIDARDKGEESLTVGPALEVEIPIFNQNQAGTSRAKAEFERATHDYVAVRHRIILEVRQAHAGYTVSRDELEMWHADMIPSLEALVDRAQKAQSAGDTSYLVVLEARQRLLEGLVRETELAAELGRTAAQLSYGVGMRMVLAAPDHGTTGSEQ